MYSLIDLEDVCLDVCGSAASSLTCGEEERMRDDCLSLFCLSKKDSRNRCAISGPAKVRSPKFI